MDEGLSAAVRKVFVALHREGLIYRDQRLVNWDPKLQTAISDLEVESRETKGSLWYIRYPIEGEPGEFITVATTRPETMLGDTAVAVHPEDARYRRPGRRGTRSCRWSAGASRSSPTTTPIPEKGTGAVKITPAHDFNDFDGRPAGHDPRPLRQRASTATRSSERRGARAPIAGMDRFAARKAIVADLEALGLLDKIEDTRHRWCRTATAPAW